MHRRALCLGFLLFACKEDPPPVEAADAGARPADAAADVHVVPTVPVAPLSLLSRLPAPPEPVAAKPGDPADALRKARPGLAPSPYTPNILTERPADGAFETIHYQLDARGERVEAVLLTFREPYRAPERRESVEEALKLRLGAGQRAAAGHRWATLDYRIELREDPATAHLELLFHRRGRAERATP